MKKVFLLISFFLIIMYSFSISYKIGLEVSGHLIPYLSISFPVLEKTEMEFGTGLIGGPDVDLDQKVILVEPMVKIKIVDTVVTM